MKPHHSKKPALLKTLALLGGGAGLVLQLLIQNGGIDSKGLLIRWYPAWLGLWGLTAAVALVLLVAAWPIHGPTSFRGSFPGSILAALGCVLAGISAFDITRTLWMESGVSIFAVTSALAVLAFALLAVCRLLEWRPGFLFYVVICVYFATEMLRMYQTWSFDPQLHEYCFQLFACIALTMTAYQLSCFGASHGRHRMLWFWGLMAVYLCLTCLNSGRFYLTGAVWAFTNLSSLRPPHRFLRRDTDQSAE